MIAFEERSSIDPTIIFKLVFHFFVGVVPVAGEFFSVTNNSIVRLIGSDRKVFIWFSYDNETGLRCANAQNNATVPDILKSGFH